MDADLARGLHDEAVSLWRVSLKRELTDAEVAVFNSTMGHLHPFLRSGFAQRYLGQGRNYRNMAEFDAQLQLWREQRTKRRRRTSHR